MKQTDSALVLSRSSFSESSLILNLYTEQGGLQAFIFQGAKKKKGSTIFPLSLVEIEFSRRTDSQLAKLYKAEALIPLSEIIFDPLKSSMALFIAEMIQKMVKENHKDQQLFNFLKKEVVWINHSQELGNYLLWFLAQLTIIDGFQPEIVATPPSYFDLQEGKLTNRVPDSPAYLEETWLHWLSSSLTMDKLSFLSLTIPHEERAKALDAWIQYFEFHHQGVRYLKSLDVIRTVFYE